MNLPKPNSLVKFIKINNSNGIGECINNGDDRQRTFSGSVRLFSKVGKSIAKNMFYSYSLSVLTLLTLTLSCTAAPRNNRLVHFYPITQEQYDTILDMTSGRPVISEGRLISSGFRTLNDWRTSLATDLRTGLREILNATGILPINTKTSRGKVDGYPLCVIKTTDADYKDDNDGDDIDPSLTHGRAEMDENNDENPNPIVSCVVVVKDREEEGHQHSHHRPSHHHNHHQQQDEQEQHEPQRPSASTVQPQPQPQPQPSQFFRSQVIPYYYTPFAVPYSNNPYYPYYNYPGYYNQGRQNTAEAPIRKPSKKSARRPLWRTVWKAPAVQRSRSDKANIRAEIEATQSTYPSYPDNKNIRAEISQTNEAGRSNYPPYPYPYVNPAQGCPNAGPQPYYARNDNDDDDDDDDDNSNEDETNDDDASGENDKNED